MNHISIYISVTDSRQIQNDVASGTLVIWGKITLLFDPGIKELVDDYTTIISWLIDWLILVKPEI